MEAGRPRSIQSLFQSLRHRPGSASGLQHGEGGGGGGGGQALPARILHKRRAR